MKPLIVKEILIIDKINQTAFYSSFKEGINVITSEHTSRGKSSVLRAIAYSFGAEANYDSIFNPTDKIFSIVFSSGEDEYRIIRQSRSFVVYKNKKINEMFSGEIQKLSYFYEKEFGFSIYLTSRDRGYVIAPPSYSFIPYFLDQDSSWKGKDTNPFKMGTQFLVDLNDVYYFHTGVINANYGKKKDELFSLEGRNREIENKCSELQKQIGSFKAYYKTNNISISKEDAEANLAVLKEKLDSSLSRQQEIQGQVFEKENLISKYSVEIKAMEKLIRKIANAENEDEVTCPNCGYSFSNKERQNYDKALIEDNIEYANYMIGELTRDIEPLKQELIRIASNIDDLTVSFNSTRNSFEKYLKCHSVSILLEQLEGDFSSLKQKEKQHLEEIEALKVEIEKSDEEKTKCNTLFKDLYLEKLNEVGIKNYERNMISPFQKARISGNKYIRSTLAFFITVLEIKAKRKYDNFNLPIIVDSPFEGDPDEINKADVINIIKDHYKTNNLGSQLFIGLREANKYFKDDEVNYVILNTEEDHLLSKQPFNEHIETINRLLEIMSKKV